MRVLLDTHVFIQLAREGPDDLSRSARRLIEDEDSDLLLSAVSLTEIAVKAKINKLSMTAANISRAVEDLRLTVISFESRHALKMFDLPLHHRDSFDRMLIATALSEGVAVVTQNVEFARYRGLKIVS